MTPGYLAGAFVFVAASCAMLPGLVRAQGAERADTVKLSLADVQRLALRNNPDFLAERREIEIAHGQLRQARVLPFNPRLQFQSPGAVEGGLNEYEASLAQAIEWAGQRGLRIGAAEAGSARARLSVSDAARRTVAATTEAFFAALGAVQRLNVARDILALNTQLLAATRTQAQEGEISVLEANLAEIEFGRARGRILAAEREASTARLDLQRLVGIPPEQLVVLIPDTTAAPDPRSLDPDSLLGMALARRPDLRARARQVEQFETLARLAAREGIPNLEIAVIAERVAGRGPAGSGAESPRFGVGVALPLPIWNRNQGIAEERRAQAAQAGHYRAATELQVRTEVAEALRAFTVAAEEKAVFQRDVVEPARANQRLLEAAFRAGKVGLPTLLLLRNQLLDAELSYWEAWLAEHRALVRLQSATAAYEISDDFTSLRAR